MGGSISVDAPPVAFSSVVTRNCHARKAHSPGTERYAAPHVIMTPVCHIFSTNRGDRSEFWGWTRPPPAPWRSWAGSLVSNQFCVHSTAIRLPRPARFWTFCTDPATSTTVVGHKSSFWPALGSARGGLPRRTKALRTKRLGTTRADAVRQGQAPSLAVRPAPLRRPVGRRTRVGTFAGCPSGAVEGLWRRVDADSIAFCKSSVRHARARDGTMDGQTSLAHRPACCKWVMAGCA